MPLRHEISRAGTQGGTPSNVNSAPFKLKFDAIRKYLSVPKEPPTARAGRFLQRAVTALWQPVFAAWRASSQSFLASNPGVVGLK
jgi:hypothetical protein